MSAAPEFADVNARLQSGDDGAAVEVFERFAGRLIGLARVRLDERLRGKVDPDDVMQSVLRSFFVAQRQGKFVLDGWDGLWALLVTMTVRKCCRQISRYKTAARDVDRDSTGGADAAGASLVDNHALARDPTPLEAVTLTELVEQLMSGLTPREQQVLTARLQGYDTAEIAAQVGRTERTVQRILAAVMQRARSIQGDAATSPTEPA